MNFRKATILAGFLLIAVLTFSQSNMVIKSAQALTSPITAPIPTPTPRPTPSPISYFTYLIRGKITYRFLNMIPMPARGVTVTAINLSNNQTFSAKSGITGAYTLEVKQASSSALYSVKVATQGAEQIKWTPEEIRKVISKDVNNYDFTGSNIIIKSAKLVK